MIPIFPIFKQLELLDKKEIDLFVNNYPPYEDFGFINLWSYDIENQVQISKLNHNLIIRFRDYTSTDQFYSFIGINEVKKTIDELLKLAKKEKVFSGLKLIPEEVIASDNNLHASFSITEDRDNFDYILLLDDLINLPGGKYSTKRRMLNNFTKFNSDITFKLLDLKNRKIDDQILDTFYLWEKKMKRDRKETLHELLAIKKLLKIADVSELHATGLYRNTSMVGFSINEVVHNNYAIGHFIKVDSSIRGIYEFFYKMNALQLFSQGCRYLNIQQDLGIEGLRISKESWKPNHFLKKYTITPK